MKKINFKQLTKEAKNDSDVLALILLGSRGKGFHKPDSDYDAWLIVKDRAGKKSKRKYKSHQFENMDFSLNTFSEFKEYAKIGSPDEWDRYDFSHIELVVCKLKSIKYLAKKKGLLPKKEQKSWINSSLDAYTNAFFRSIKTKKKGYHLGSHLEATASIPPLLHALFGLELRHAPFYGYLKNELDEYPLKKLPMSKQMFLKDVQRILNGDINAQQKMFKKMKNNFINKGYKKVFDAWEGKDDQQANLKV